jgi:hypothetical protein
VTDDAPWMAVMKDGRKVELSKRWRHGGFMVKVGTLLDQGETLEPDIEAVLSWLEGEGYDVEVLSQGDRPAFPWECPDDA